MLSSDKFSFSLSVSEQCFQAKPPQDEVGKIVFAPKTLTIKSAIQCALEGRAFCYSFISHRKDGVITMRDKTESNFQTTSTIIYDFDDMDVTMMDFIEGLPFKPTFAYPTYSNGQPQCGFRYRLAFVLDEVLSGVSSFKTVYHSIASANEFILEVKGKNGGWDYRNVSQFYYGTCFSAETYNGDIIYSPNDFPISSFVLPAQKTVFRKNRTFDLFISGPPIDSAFLEDFFHLTHGEFFRKYRDEYHSNYSASLKTPLILDESGMFYRYPDDFVCVKYRRQGKRVLRWEIGEDRKKKIYITAQIMLFNLPSLTIENLLYNLRMERQWYYINTDNKLSNEYLVQVAKNAYNKPYSLQPSKHPSFSVNKAYWAEMGVSANKAKVIVQRYLKEQTIMGLYDTSQSIRKNYMRLREQGIKVSRNTLSRMVSERLGQIVNAKSPHTYLSCRDNPDTIRILDLIHQNNSITQSEIAQATGLSLITIKRRMKQMEGISIIREGSSRSGRWMIISQEEEIQEDKNGWPKNITLDWGPDLSVTPDYLKYESYLQ